MKIRTRLLVLLVPAIFVALALLATLAYLNASRQAHELANAEAQRIASTQSALIFDKLRQTEAVVESLVSTFLEIRQNGDVGRETVSRILKGATASSSDFFGVWALWEPNAYDGRDADFVGNEDLGNSEGRANGYWMRESDGRLGYYSSENYDGDHYYVQPKQQRRITIIPPYRDPDSKVLMSTIAAPIIDEGTVLGAVGIDIEMGFIQGLLKAVRPYEIGYAMLVSDTGAIVADPSGSGTDDTLPSVPPDILEKIKSGGPFVVDGVSVYDKSPVQCFYTPVRLESFSGPWYFMVALPMDKVMAESNRNLLVQLAISAMALAVLIALVFFTANGVSRPLQRIVAHANAVASGKHDASLDKRGFARELLELYEALNSMLNSLLDTMRQVEESSAESARGAEKARLAMAEAEEARKKTEENHTAMLEVAARVDAVSRKVRDTSQELTEKIAAAGQEALEQNKLMDETVTSIAGMSDSIVRVSNNTEDAAEFTEQTRTRATEGATVVNRTLEAVDGIRQEIEALGGQIDVLSKNSEAVGAILGLINDIADQTNLLALNAAIEAARAGEAGRGFAVVADEVRKLAEKTVEATRQVDESIKGIRSSMRVSAEGVTRTAATVQATVELGQEARASLEDIVNLVQGMSEQIHDIARLCREQTATSEQVAAIVEHLRSLSVSVGKAMSEGADISSALVPEARELGLLVDQLTSKR